MSEDIGECDVAVALFNRLLFRSRIAVPRFTPSRWFECDVWRVTTNGFVDEYEIKLSPSDYYRDFKKKDRPWKYNDWQTRTKHERLISGDCNPNRFWFVMPAGMVAVENVPKHAGVIVFSNLSPTWMRIVFLRHAPKLHDGKVDDRVMAKAAQSCCRRMWRLMCADAGEGA